MTAVLVQKLPEGDDWVYELKLDGFLLTHPPDLAYLTNFTGDDSIGLITEKDFFLVTDFRYQEQAELEAGWLKMSVRDGKMASNFVVFDQMEVGRQLGLLPPDGSPPDRALKAAFNAKTKIADMIAQARS